MAGRSRDAVSTIKGYYYQFDYYILQLLQLEREDESVRIEGIEDVDIIDSNGIEAVQCKYYDGTKCTPSVVGEAIRPMLIHFAEHKDDPYCYHYSLYAHYNSGQDSVTTPLTVSYIKQKFFTYTKEGIKHELHNELGLSNSDLDVFIKRLNLNLNSEIYEAQIDGIIDRIQRVFHCSEFDARYFYYNNAVSFVKEVAVKKTLAARTVSKEKFLEAIRTKRFLFDRWYIEYIGFEKYYKSARRNYFARTNISPIHRFFLIQADDIINDTELAEIVMRISAKWSRLSSREKTPFCPYICFHDISLSRLSHIKSILLENDFHIWDGYEYKDAVFSPASLARPVNFYTGVKAKLINKTSQVSPVLELCSGRKEVYQFYLDKPFYDRGTTIGASFQIQNTSDVQMII